MIAELPSVDDVLASLERAVEKKGADYVYTLPNGTRAGEVDPDTNILAGCLYVHGNEPGCIVGHVLHDWGVSLDQLRSYEQDTAETVIQHLMASKDIVVDQYDPVVEVLRTVQTYQDNGETWGEAVQRVHDDEKGYK